MEGTRVSFSSEKNYKMKSLALMSERAKLIQILMSTFYAISATFYIHLFLYLPDAK